MARQRAIEFEGPTHEEGGIMLDIDGDMSPDAEVEGGEVMVGNRVYSDSMEVPEEILEQLRMSGIKMKKGITFAGAAKKLANMRSTYEEMSEDTRVEDSNTGALMGERVATADKMLFAAQQELNGDAPEDGVPEFEGGGFLGKTGEWIANNPDTIGMGIGAGLGALVGQPALGAQLGGAAGTAIGGTYDSPEEQEIMEGRADARNQAMISQAGKPFGGVPQFEKGGELDTLDYLEPEPLNVGELGGMGDIPASDLDYYAPREVPDAKLGREPFKISAGNIANVATYIANRSSINDTEADIDPTYVRPDTMQYRDRSGPVREDARRSFEDMLETVGRSSAGEGTGRAQQQELFADYLQSLEGIQAQENQYADQIKYENVAMKNRASSLNAQIANQINSQNLQRRNEQDIAEVDARNALLQGFMGNEQMKQSAQRDSILMAIQAYRDGGRGVADRMARSMGYEDYADLMDDYTSGQTITI